ncbi:MAG: hypothetical protein N2559_15705, partial [Anaerolineae bacterium]|nr:hypothetical protein [Anaerolineae bacterium]
KDRPANAPTLTFNLPPISKFDASKSTKFTGTSTASTIHYAAVIPGAVIAQGSLPVTNGKFEYTFDPAAIRQCVQTYDTTNQVSGKPELGDVVHLTFFSQEKASDGKAYWSFVRLIIRGNTVHYAR